MTTTSVRPRVVLYTVYTGKAFLYLILPQLAKLNLYSHKVTSLAESAQRADRGCNWGRAPITCEARLTFGHSTISNNKFIKKHISA